MNVIVVIDNFNYEDYYVWGSVVDMFLNVIVLVVELFLDMVFEISFNVIEMNVFEMMMMFMMNMNGSFCFLFDVFYWGFMFKLSIYDDDVSSFVIVFWMSM